MKLERVEVVHVAIPLVSPFRTSFGTMTTKDTFLLHVVTDTAEGWSEFAADPQPRYCSEFVAGAELVLRDFLVPRVAALPTLTAALVGPAVSGIKGHELAKAALETAVLDAELRSYGMPLAVYLGAVRERVPAGVSVGIKDSVPELLDDVERLSRRGLRADQAEDRTRLGHRAGTGRARALRRRTAPPGRRQHGLHPRGRGTLRRLDEFGLLLIEQPLDEDDLVQHAELQQRDRDPCLPRRVHGRRPRRRRRDRAGRVPDRNIKPGRVGGFLEARRVHDIARAGVPVWCGGMLETGIGRAPNLALAAMPGFTLPGDTSASARYFADDITEPFEMAPDGHHAGSRRARHRRRTAAGRPTALHAREAGPVRGLTGSWPEVTAALD